MLPMAQATALFPFPPGRLTWGAGLGEQRSLGRTLVVGRGMPAPLWLKGQCHPSTQALLCANEARGCTGWLEDKVEVLGPVRPAWRQGICVLSVTLGKALSFGHCLFHCSCDPHSAVQPCHL